MVQFLPASKSKSASCKYDLPCTSFYYSLLINISPNQIIGQIEARDPENGAVFYHHASSGKSQWEKPTEVAPTTVFATPPPLEDWIEAFDESTGT